MTDRKLTPDDTQARIEFLGQFMACLTHELRTPLSVIRNALFMVRRMVPQTPQVVDCLDMIDSEVDELNAILTRLVELRHGWTPTHEAVDLQALATESIEHIDPDHRMKWHFDLRPSPFMIWCDRTRFKFLLEQLFRNAVAATRGSGEVRVSAMRSDDADIIRVADTGGGVPEQLRATLFEPFVTTRETRMGLGLTYCREVMKKHDGTIELAETSPAGTVFEIRLPHRPS